MRIAIDDFSLKVCAVGSAAVGFCGYLGGYCIKVLDPTVVPAAHGLTLGLWAPLGIGIYALAEKVNRDSVGFNLFVGFTGGYVASCVLSNLMGLPITLGGPVASITALAIVGSIVASIAAPVFICLGIGVGSMIALPVLSRH